MNTTKTAVVIVGGYHDGLTGTAPEECVRRGFLIEKSVDEDGEEWWHGYYAAGDYDESGRLIFRPGKAAS